MQGRRFTELARIPVRVGPVCGFSDFEDLRLATDAQRVVVACLAWYYSTNSGTGSISADTASSLSEAVDAYVPREGWIGDLAFCREGDHVAVGHELLTWQPPGCNAATSYLYQLLSLKQMADCVG